MNKTLIDKLGKIYKSTSEDFVFNYMLPSFFIITYLCIITIKYIKTNLLESKTTWSSSKCVPKYMFVSGLLNKEPTESILGSTYDNFEKCVNSLRIYTSGDTTSTSSTTPTTSTTSTTPTTSTMPAILTTLTTPTAPVTPTNSDIINNYNKMLEALKIHGILKEAQYNEYKSKNIEFSTYVYNSFLKEFDMDYTQLNNASVEDIKNIIYSYIKKNYTKILTTYKMLNYFNEDQYKEFSDKNIEFMTLAFIEFITRTGMSYTQLNNSSVEDVKYIVTSLQMR